MLQVLKITIQNTYIHPHWKLENLKHLLLGHIIQYHNQNCFVFKFVLTS